MSRIIALQYLLLDGKEYFPGDVIKAPDEATAASLVANGAAIQGADSAPDRVTATPAAATPGLPGLATGGEATGEDLVGKVPETRERVRKRRKV